MEKELIEENWLDETEYKYVLGQDPGGTTGVAVLRYTDETPAELVFLHQIPNGREGFFWFFVGTEVGEDTNFTSVSEQWETREGVFGANLEPVYIEGVQYAIWADQTVYQLPKVKAMIGDDFLKSQNLWTEGKRHQMDALMHALYYLRSIGHKPTLEQLSGEEVEPIAQPGEADEKTLPQPGDSGEGTGEQDASAQDGFAEAMEKLAERIREVAEAVEEAGQSASDAAAALAQAVAVDGSVEPKDTATRPQRRLNGAFIGFDED